MSKPTKSLKRVLLICQDFPPITGGVATMLRNLATGLPQLDDSIQLDIISLDNSSAEKNITSNFNRQVTVHRLGGWLPRKDSGTTPFWHMFVFVILAFFKGLRLLIKNDYQLIYSVYALPTGVPGAVLSKLFNKAHVVTIIGGDIYKPKKNYSAHRIFFFRWVIEVILNYATTKYNTISSDVMKKLHKYYNVSKSGEVTNIGADLGAIPNLSELDRGGEKNKKMPFTFVTMSRLDARKNISGLIESFADLDSESVRLVIIGSGPEEPKLRRLTSEFALTNVEFAGFVSEEEKLSILSQADAFVLNSYHEGFGIVVIEALAHGLPVISTRNGGVEDIIISEEFGLMVPVADKSQLTAAMRKMVAGDAKFDKQRLAARAREFDQLQVTQNYLKFLKSAINE